VLDVDTNAELILLIISKIDGVMHNNVVTADNRTSAKSLWKAITDRFASSQASDRAQIFNKFLSIKFKEDLVESFVMEVKVSIKKLVDVGIDLPQDILAYLLLFKFPDSLQSLKQQIMHSDKDLLVEFVCNHLNQFNNENKAEFKESSSTTHAALCLAKGKHPNNQNQKIQEIGAPRDIKISNRMSIMTQNPVAISIRTELLNGGERHRQSGRLHRNIATSRPS
jgi:hypothetical protein